MTNERSPESTPQPPVLLAVHVSKTYRKRRWFSSAGNVDVSAVQDVSLAIGRGRCLGLVGESGSGKSTLARCLACMEIADSGEVWVDDRNLLSLRARELHRMRRQIQLVFQGSTASLNPRLSALDIVSEPLDILRQEGKRERHERALEIMTSVGLPRQCAQRRPSEMSGGQRQRLAIARALTLQPKLLILDESLAGLDLPVQAQIVNLLVDLQASLGISYLFISHDLRLAVHLADDLAVMAGGCIVEHGPAQQIARDPQHPLTRALLAAATESMSVELR